KIYQMNLIFEHSKKKEITPNLEPEKIKFSLENANKLLGLNIKENELPKLLEKMGYSYNPKTKEVEVPAWRTDIMHEVDIIEDLAIAYGYENFIPEIPSISGVGEIDKKELVKKKIAEILAGLNFLETSSYHLLSLEEVSRFSEKPEIEVEDSKSEYKFLRNSLTLTSLNILSKNIDTEYPQRIFELGRVFEIDHKGERETGIISAANRMAMTEMIFPKLSSFICSGVLSALTVVRVAAIFPNLVFMPICVTFICPVPLVTSVPAKTVSLCVLTTASDSPVSMASSTET
ncbi:MAG: hypothetical protein AABX71_02020, partial [Nanoarchaeota archaeon]